MCVTCMQELKLKIGALARITSRGGNGHWETVPGHLLKLRKRSTWMQIGDRIPEYDLRRWANEAATFRGARHGGACQDVGKRPKGGIKISSKCARPPFGPLQNGGWKWAGNETMHQGAWLIDLIPCVVHLKVIRTASSFDLLVTSLVIVRLLSMHLKVAFWWVISAVLTLTPLQSILSFHPPLSHAQQLCSTSLFTVSLAVW